MAMNNNFEELAEQFLNEHPESLHEDEIRDEVLGFLRGRGIDPAWHDEACEVIIEYFETNQ